MGFCYATIEYLDTYNSLLWSFYMVPISKTKMYIPYFFKRNSFIAFNCSCTVQSQGIKKKNRNTHYHFSYHQG